MKVKRSDTRGETLAETIVALSILAITITVAGTIMTNSLRNLRVAKQRLIAVNIAREGIEAMRSIRDTNWLLYSDKRRQCWNHDPDPLLASCDGSDPIIPGDYIIYKSSDLTWQLEPATPDNMKLSLVDIDDSIDSDDNSDPEDDTDMFNHIDASIPDPYGTLAQNTLYSRILTIEYLVNQPMPPDDSIADSGEWTGFGATEGLNRMRLTSRAEWSRGDESRAVELKTIITDHLGRENLSD